MVAEIHAVRGPGIEVVARGDGSTHALLLPHAPVLVERARAFDRWCVHPLGAVDVVGATIAGDRAHEALPAGRPPGAPTIDDVILDQRILRPTVQRQIRIAVRTERARVGHGTATAGVPALAAHPVVDVAPLGGIAAATVHAEGHVAAVLPERVVVAVVGAR